MPSPPAARSAEANASMARSGSSPGELHPRDEVARRRALRKGERRRCRLLRRAVDGDGVDQQAQLLRRKVGRLGDAFERRLALPHQAGVHPVAVQQAGERVPGGALVRALFGVRHEHRQPERNRQGVRLPLRCAGPGRHALHRRGDDFRVDADHRVGAVAGGARGLQHPRAAGVDVDRHGRRKRELGGQHAADSRRRVRELGCRGARLAEVAHREVAAADHQAGAPRRRFPEGRGEARQHPRMARHRVRHRGEERHPLRLPGGEREPHEHVPAGVRMVGHPHAREAELLGPDREPRRLGERQVRGVVDVDAQGGVGRR